MKNNSKIVQTFQKCLKAIIICSIRKSWNSVTQQLLFKILLRITYEIVFFLKNASPKEILNNTKTLIEIIIRIIIIIQLLNR
jgi:hypothetical protein